MNDKISFDDATICRHDRPVVLCQQCDDDEVKERALEAAVIEAALHAAKHRGESQAYDSLADACAALRSWREKSK